MTLRTRTELKAFFETGDIPTQQEFEDLIDSSVNQEEDGKMEQKKNIMCGFSVDRFESTISWDNLSRTLSVSPTVTEFTYYSNNQKFVETGTLSNVINDTITGMHWFYIDDNSTVQSTTVWSMDVAHKYAFLAIGYWNATQAKMNLVADERHSYDRDHEWHKWAHATLRTQFAGGLNITNIVTDQIPTGTQAEKDAVAQFNVADGIIRDEDLVFNITGNDTGVMNIPLFYRDGADGHWRRGDNNAFAVKTGGTGRAVYNHWNGTVWETPECEDNSLVCGHIVAITDIDYNVITVMGQVNYVTIQEARVGALVELSSLILDDIPTAEMKAIGTVIFRTNDIFDNAVKSNIAAVDGTETHVDHRTVTISAATDMPVIRPYISGEIQGLLDNMALDQPVISDPYLDVDDIKIDISVDGRNSLRFWSEGIIKELATPVTIILEQGVDNDIALQTVYAFWSEQEQKVNLATSLVMPSGPFLPICYVGVQGKFFFDGNGPQILQRTTETLTHDGQGALSRMREHTRLAEGNRWWSGCETQYIVDGTGKKGIKMLDGVFYQMNRQTIGEIDSTVNGFFITNADRENPSLTNYNKHYDIDELEWYSDGTAIATDDYVVFYVYAVGNNNHDNCKLLFRIPEHGHSTLEDLNEFVDHSHVPTVDNNYRSVGFPIAAVMMKKLADGFENAFTISTETTEWKWDTYAGSDSSPNYPSNYPNNSWDTWSITGPVGATRMSIDFSVFITEGNYDYLYLKGGSAPSTSSYHKRFHGSLGSFNSGTIYDRVVYGLFDSDGSVTRKGFIFYTYKAWHPVTIGSSEPSTKIIAKLGG